MNSNATQISANVVQYSNHFGTLELTPVTDFMPVKRINKTHPAAVANTFDIDTAEKIALITGNRKIQICPHLFPTDGLAYLILHNSASTAAICKVDLKSFTCPCSAKEMIGALNAGCAVLPNNI